MCMLCSQVKLKVRIRVTAVLPSYILLNPCIGGGFAHWGLIVIEIVNV